MKIRNTILNSMCVDGGDSVVLESGTVVSVADVYPNGDLSVRSGGSVGALVVHSGGICILASGGQAGSAVVDSSGIFRIWNHAACSSVTLNGGTMSIYEGGRAVLTAFKSGEISKQQAAILQLPPPKTCVVGEPSKDPDVFLWNENGYVYGKNYANQRVMFPSGTIGSALALKETACLLVSKGAIVKDLELLPAASAYLEGDGQDIIVSEGAFLRVTGTARNVRVISGGSMRLCNSGSVINAVINSGGSISIHNSARLTTLYVCAGGVLEVSDNGVAYIVEIGNGGKALLRDNAELSVVPDAEGKHGTVEIDAQHTARFRLIKDQPERQIAVNFLDDLEEVPR